MNREYFIKYSPSGEKIKDIAFADQKATGKYKGTWLYEYERLLGIDGDGNFYFMNSENKRTLTIKKYNSDARLLDYKEIPVFSNHWATAFTSEGEIYFRETDDSGKEIHRLNSNFLPRNDDPFVAKKIVKNNV